MGEPASDMQIVKSREQDAIEDPSGENASDKIAP
jgi:hypothetical protein